MFKNTLYWSIAVNLFFLMIIISMSMHGYGNRIIAEGAATFRVDSPEKAYTIWNEKKIRGRILLLFDNYPHMRGLNDYKTAPQLTRSNLIEFTVFNNMIRKIYFIVPDSKWEGFRLQEIMNPLRAAHGLERGLFLYNINGIPLIAVSESSLPYISEKTLVYINTLVFNASEAVNMLSQKGITSDIIISYEGSEK